MKCLHNLAARPAPALLTAGALLAASAFFAAPARAQVPITTLPTTLVWSEEFEHAGYTQHRPVAANPAFYAPNTDWYTGNLGETYSADANWLPEGTMAGAIARCNGWVVNNSETTAPPSDTACSSGGGRYVIVGANANVTGPNAWGNLRRMAYAMGLAQGLPATDPSLVDASHNNAVASLTNAAGGGSNGPTLTQLKLNVIPTPAGTPYQTVKGHFYVASVMFAAVHCSIDMAISGGATGWSDPVENVNLLVNGSPAGGTLDLKYPTDFMVPGANPARTSGNVCPPSVQSGGTSTARIYDVPKDAPTTVVPPSAAHPSVTLPTAGAGIPTTGFYPYQDRPPAGVTPQNAPAAGNIYIVRRHSLAYRATQSGDTLGIQLDNTQTSGAANDVAFDQLRVTDATPYLYKSFNAPHPELYQDGTIGQGDTGTLTFIIVNTEDNLEKTGMSFTDVLPAGVTIAGPITSDCKTNGGVAPNMAAPLGGTTITVTDLAIPDDAGTCTLTVKVNAPNLGVYTNDVNGQADPNDGLVTMDGLIPMRGPAKLYVDNIVFSKTAEVTAGAFPGLPPTGYVTKAGDKITYTFTLKNGGPYGDDELDVLHLTLHDPLNPWPFLNNSGFTGFPGLDITAADIQNPAKCTITRGTPYPPPVNPYQLAGQDSITCKIEYTVTQDDIDHAVTTAAATGPGTQAMLFNVDATATVDAHPPNDATNIEPLTSPPVSANVPINAPSGLQVTKTPNKSVLPDAGTGLIYTIKITNNGTTTLTGVGLTDVFTNGATPAPSSCRLNVPPSGVGGTNLTLPLSETMAPNDVITCTVNYTVTPADVTAGHLSNTATATGKNPANQTISGSGTATLDAMAISLAFSKTATVKSALGVTQSSAQAVGDVITYTFTLANNGAGVIDLGATLVWSDPHNYPSAATPDANGFTGDTALALTTAGNCKVDGLAPPATLASGKALVCTTTHTVTQNDIDNAAASYASPKIQNKNATVTMTIHPAADPLSTVTRTLSDSVDVPVANSENLWILKQADTSMMPAVGGVIHYTIRFENRGIATLKNVTLTDTLSNGAPLAVTCSAGAGNPVVVASLAPGAGVDCTASYTVTAADVAARTLTNTAQVSSMMKTAVSSSPSAVTVGSSSGATAIPTLDARGLALLALMLGALAFWARRERRS